jgi:hypothetical protein
MLPKIEHPVFTLELISTGKKIRYRPFTVKEEKILLVAQMSREEEQVIDAIKQVISNCVVDPGFDVDKIATFDAEYIFINLRSKSVNNIVEMVIRDAEDDKEYTFNVDLDKLDIVKHPEHTNKIQIDENMGMVLKYPNFKVAASIVLRAGEDNITALIEMMSKCIEKIYEGDKVYVFGEDFDEKEALQFVNDLPIEAIDAMQGFFDTFPTIEHTINYKNSLGNERSYKLSGISDFFI